MLSRAGLPFTPVKHEAPTSAPPHRSVHLHARTPTPSALVQPPAEAAVTTGGEDRRARRGRYSTTTQPAAAAPPARVLVRVRPGWLIQSSDFR
jgi:hypothetical protein